MPTRSDGEPAPRSGQQPGVGRPGAAGRSRPGGDSTATPSARSGAAPGEPTVTTYAAGRRGTALPVRPSVVSMSSAARFAERARARRRLARRDVLVAAGAVVAVGVTAWLLLWSPVFRLDQAQVTVAGAGTVVAVDQVREVVAGRGTTPLPRLDTVGLRRDVLDVPGVREAQVSRAWPRGLHIELVSREPVAAVPEQPEEAPDAGAPGFALVDMEGVQVGRVDAAPDGLPVVQVPVGEARTLAAVLTVLEGLPPELLAEVGEVSAQSQDTVTMALRDGARVDWGSGQDTALKVAVLSALRAAPESAGASVFDVSAPTLPITK
ncbi:cell division protein FtsQ/DivIB [Cellulomonas chengniuliangii]|uniref:Cell division protein FtsQ/DivIB n=1 Tax=Cellulomonas chengniuliangii TaxID=2968084 RepID=A0ABY5KUA3_9CELL|nr:cell division protein FtsQ/DivIB [Cellulomonas chengniuliangii]MCC2310223.1 cell division protein FtsQ/DivIB [Cellulomonas chengniuliangii]UUI74117.1 cell division protein FtsQ/DivIB [Cellulomonas chengniuliangii]